MTSDHDQLLSDAEQSALDAVRDPRLIPRYRELTAEAAIIENANSWKSRKGSTMTQCEKILNHMRKNGSITLREAFLDYAIQSFPRRIADLREAGYNIVGVSKVHPTTGQDYTRYYLVEAKVPA